MSDKDICPKCGYPWVGHEFAVPEPYCPSSKEGAELIEKSTEKLRSLLNAWINKETE